MTKHYCDKCGRELTADDRGDRPTVKCGHWTFEIIHAHKGTWNSGVICRPCTKKLLDENWKNATNKDWTAS